MLTKYIQAAMRHAEYKPLEDGSTFGEIPVVPGVWANADTADECREELQDVLEGWLLLAIADHDPLPAIDDITLTIEEAA
jgi:predicted RNase H-like HicB family nuclease